MSSSLLCSKSAGSSINGLNNKFITYYLPFMFWNLSPNAWRSLANSAAYWDVIAGFCSVPVATAIPLKLGSNPMYKMSLLCLLFHHRPDGKKWRFVAFSVFFNIFFYINNLLCGGSSWQTGPLEQFYFIQLQQLRSSSKTPSHSSTEWNSGFLAIVLTHHKTCQHNIICQNLVWWKLLVGQPNSTERALTMSKTILSLKLMQFSCMFWVVTMIMIGLLITATTSPQTLAHWLVF